MRRLALAVAIVSLACAGPQTASKPSPILGKKVDVAARSLDGRAVDLPAHGARATVVDFWATW